MSRRGWLGLGLLAAAVAVGVGLDPGAAGRTFDRVVAGELDPGSPVAWIVLLVLATFGTEDLTCVGAGLLVAAGRLDLVIAVGGCALGIFIGDVGLYGLGALLARYGALGRLKIPPRKLATSREWLRRRGVAAVLLSRFMPGTRLPTYVAAGALGMPLWTFLGWFSLAVGIWTPILVGGTALLGQEFAERLGSFQKGLGVAALVTLLGVFALRLRDRRVRSRWLGRWERFVQWEFWPVWIVYPPVVLGVLGQAIRFRSLTLFTLANPAIPGGGLIGESKADILGRLPERVVARFRSLGAGGSERWVVVEAFCGEIGTDLPIVLKPEVGERGAAVRIVRTPEEGRAWLEEHQEPFLVQEYVAGIEVGIFWWRWPRAGHGEVFSIVEKRLPRVVGDGRRTLEELVLDDRTLRSRAGVLLGGDVDPERIPKAQEEVLLLEVGAHCRGTVFLEGERFATAELRAEIDRIGCSFDGFCFGRFDLRAPDEQSLARGEGLKILELNGVASEAAHIYDPRYSLLEAWRVLIRQWRLAFEIGAAQRELGLEPDSLRDVVRRIRQGRKLSQSAPST